MKIFNEYLEATFTTQGAELVSLKNKDGVEYIWQAIPEYWARHAPVLFPIVGKLKDDKYQYNGETYQMSQHGFARDIKYNIISQDQYHIRFSLTTLSETLAKYPFRFELIINYELEESSLKVTYEVKNLDAMDIYFSIGAHPAFNCPMIEGEAKTDYWLEFEKKESTQSHMLESGLFSGKTKDVIDGKSIKITKKLFEDDALVFKELKSDKVSLVSPSKKWLTVDYTDFPYLGIWSKSAEAPFVCIEPWQGLADTADHDYDLTKKENIKKLEKAGKFVCSFTIHVHQ